MILGSIRRNNAYFLRQDLSIPKKTNGLRTCLETLGFVFFYFFSAENSTDCIINTYKKYFFIRVNIRFPFRDTISCVSTQMCLQHNNQKNPDGNFKNEKTFPKFFSEINRSKKKVTNQSQL